jgi:3D (Asp-Asp-Asp) domain-containing protein
MDRYDRVFITISFICLFLLAIYVGIRTYNFEVLEREIETLKKAVKTSEPVKSDSLSVRTYRKGDEELKDVSPSFNIQRLGEYKLTAYCPCKFCCGPNAKGITFTGKPVRVGHIAVDPKVIPLHSRVSIEWLGEYVAEDTGGAIKGKRIDIYFNTHQEALNFGVQYRNVYLIKEN